MTKFRLTIRLPQSDERIRLDLNPGRPLLTTVLREANHPLNTRCGLRGLCDSCLVELIDGQLEQADSGEPIVSSGEIRPLRACEVRIPESGAAEILVPPRSLLAHQPQVVTSFRLNVPRAHDPLWQSCCATPGQITDGLSLLEEIRELIRLELDCEMPLEISAEASELRPDDQGRYRVAVEFRGDHRTIDRLAVMEPAFGAAVDIGTTTVVVIIVELTTGRVVGNASALNAQTKLGDNVLTRINLCMNEPRLIRRLQQAIVRGTLVPLLTEAIDGAGIDRRQLACMVVSGNTTMLHLLLGVDPSSMGVAPFTPTFLDHRVVDTEHLSLTLAGRKKSAPSDDIESRDRGSTSGDAGVPFAIHLLPGAAAYVGADITAGVLASGMAYRSETCVLVDLGTNGEIVLQHKDVLVGCATAAGPAFEGAGLTYGMRAGAGAIGHVYLDQPSANCRVEVIGRADPVGICGTAYIDFVARAREIGLVNRTARFGSDATAAVIQHETHGRAFVVARGRDDEPLLITEADMASLLQAKAAIAAGVICLMNHAGLSADEVDTVYLAGGFGFHMHIESLLGCGMLPGFRPDQVEMVGNTSLAGAYLALLDSGALREIRHLSDRMEIVELNLDPQFEMIYIDQLALPE